MCDFKPGDEVVYAGRDGVPMRSDHREAHDIKRGMVFIVSAVTPWKDTDLAALQLRGMSPSRWFDSRCFRKVQRRDLSAWLASAVEMPALDKRKVPAQ